MKELSAPNYYSRKGHLVKKNHFSSLFCIVMRTLKLRSVIKEGVSANLMKLSADYAIHFVQF